MQANRRLLSRTSGPQIFDQIFVARFLTRVLTRILGERGKTINQLKNFCDGPRRASPGLAHRASEGWLLGPLFCPDRWPDGLPAWALATFRPKTAQDRRARPQERPKTANISPKSGPRPPHRPQIALPLEM